jgi:hypothetical protein
MFFIPIVSLGCKFLNLGATKQSNDYDELVGIISSIREGEKFSTPVYLNKKSIIVGFTKDADRFENYYRKISSLVFFFDRPYTCEDSKACICLCQDYDFKETREFPYSKECEKPRCRSIDTVDFIPETQVGGRYESLWKGGFLYLRELPSVLNGLSSGEYRGVSSLTEMGNTLATRTFYVERYGDIVGVCLQNPSEVPCIPEEIKEQIDSSNSIEQPAE